MANAVLPALLVVVVVGESIHDELVDATERDLLVGRVANRHGDQRDVGVRWFLVVMVVWRMMVRSETGPHVVMVGQVEGAVDRLLYERVLDAVAESIVCRGEDECWRLIGERMHYRDGTQIVEIELVMLMVGEGGMRMVVVVMMIAAAVDNCTCR